MSEEDAESLVARARSLSSPEEAAVLYDDWAATYDRDVFGVLGVTGSIRIADLFAEFVSERTTEVLDLGCGTGAVGRQLHHHGFALVDGVDLSPAMLDVAADTGAYRRLTPMDLTRPIPDGPTYGGAVSAGTFTTGHVGPAAIGEITKLLRPGAVVAWVIAVPVWDSFAVGLYVSGYEVLHQSVEAIRTNGPPEYKPAVAGCEIHHAERSAPAKLIRCHELCG
jgi:SAM-dependent methyltransferase